MRPLRLIWLMEKELLPLAGNQVLIEFSFFAEPPNAEQVVFQMQLKGYRPILAHVERYPYYVNPSPPSWIACATWASASRVTCSPSSATMVRTSKSRPASCCSVDHYDFLGTDCHNAEHLAKLQDFRVDSRIARLMEAGQWNVL